MIIDINAIDKKIEALKLLKKAHHTGMKKLVKNYANQKLILDGPDRGYMRTEWHDDAAKDVHDELHKQWYHTDKKITTLKGVKRKLNVIEKELNDVL